MATQTDATVEPRIPLSRDRVLRAGVDLADRGGITAVSMRKLGQQLGVEAMSLYNHVDNKEDLLDGMVEVVMGEINAASDAIDLPAGDWKIAARRRILAARSVLLQHPWAPGVIESRTAMSPAVLHYFDGLGRLFRDGGFSIDLIHHGMHALGSRALGFTQELYDEGSGELDAQSAALVAQQMADDFPFISEMLLEITHDDDESTLGWCDDQTEFEFGLDLILDGLDRIRAAESA